MSDVLPALAEGLNFQQEQFCLAFVANGGNASAAASEAGYAQPWSQGARLLKNASVAAYIRAERDKLYRLSHLSPDHILHILSEMADFDLSAILADNGTVDRAKLKAYAKNLQSIEVEGGKTKVKGPDRMRAINLLMDHYGMTKQAQVNVQVNLDFGERMAARRTRALEGKG